MKKSFLSLAPVAAIALLLPQDAWPQKPEAMRRVGVLFVGAPPSAGARELGITLPQSILIRADKVVD